MLREFISSFITSSPKILFCIFDNKYFAIIYSEIVVEVKVFVDATAYSGPDPIFTVTSEIIDACDIDFSTIARVLAFLFLAYSKALIVSAVYPDCVIPITKSFLSIIFPESINSEALITCDWNLDMFSK